MIRPAPLYVGLASSLWFAVSRWRPGCPGGFLSCFALGVVTSRWPSGDRWPASSLSFRFSGWLLDWAFRRIAYGPDC